jgi:hypothetical protein
LYLNTDPETAGRAQTRPAVFLASIAPKRSTTTRNLGTWCTVIPTGSFRWELSRLATPTSTARIALTSTVIQRRLVAHQVRTWC